MDGARTEGGPAPDGARSGANGHVIVLGNEKGGSGKSTTAMHVFVALARAGKRVGAMDLDLRQQSFFRYLENRRAYAERSGAALLMPDQASPTPSDLPGRAEAEAADRAGMRALIADLRARCDFIVIDCPGSHTPFSQEAHASADTLITPLNDSLIDFDLLARVDPATGKIKGPSIYSEMVWRGRQVRAQAGLKPIDWIVMRNRMATLDARNKRVVGKMLGELSRRIGFRVAPGFSERVIFRELFLSGLTLLDIKGGGDATPLTMSHIAARQEVRELIRNLALPGVDLAT
ncbi:MAG: ATPase [Alphaproteobacteria bacterium HGW-Alphaproteobacteria-8]|nr:MAG: ATPase [Alphaproteobacteria bacterium HGW-Alphaproteobacteria-8]